MGSKSDLVTNSLFLLRKLSGAHSILNPVIHNFFSLQRFPEVFFPYVLFFGWARSQNGADKRNIVMLWNSVWDGIGKATCFVIWHIQMESLLYGPGQLKTFLREDSFVTEWVYYISHRNANEMYMQCSSYTRNIMSPWKMVVAII